MLWARATGGAEPSQLYTAAEGLSWMVVTVPLAPLEGLGELRARKMFGDYLVYLNDRPALLVCDGTPFAKPLPCVAELLEDRPTAPPYEGAKAYYVLDPEDRDTLRRAAELVSQNSPPPKKRRRKA